MCPALAPEPPPWSLVPFPVPRRLLRPSWVSPCGHESLSCPLGPHSAPCGTQHSPLALPPPHPVPSGGLSAGGAAGGGRGGSPEPGGRAMPPSASRSPPPLPSLLFRQPFPATLGPARGCPLVRLWHQEADLPLSQSQIPQRGHPMCPACDGRLLCVHGTMAKGVSPRCSLLLLLYSCSLWLLTLASP